MFFVVLALVAPGAERAAPADRVRVRSGGRRHAGHRRRLPWHRLGLAVLDDGIRVRVGVRRARLPVPPRSRRAGERPCRDRRSGRTRRAATHRARRPRRARALADDRDAAAHGRPPSAPSRPRRGRRRARRRRAGRPRQPQPGAPDGRHAPRRHGGSPRSTDDRGGPSPTLEDLDHLLADYRSAGISVRAEVGRADRHRSTRHVRWPATESSRRRWPTSRSTHRPPRRR